MGRSPDKAMRKSIYTKWYGGTDRAGKCFCGCNNTVIWEDTVVYGHIIPYSKGGSTNMENLRPICVSCNSSMGNKHMAVFLKDHPEYVPLGPVEGRTPRPKRNIRPCTTDGAQSNIVSSVFCENLPGMYKLDTSTYLQIVDETTLPMIEIWEHQRTLDEQRVDEIEAYFIQCAQDESNAHLGILRACKKSGDSKILIVDGQHRFQAYKKTYGTHHRWKLVVHVTTVQTDEEILEIFKLINKSVPVPDLYFDPISRKSFIDIITAYRERKLSHMTYVGKAPRISLLSPYSAYLAEALYDKDKLDETGCTVKDLETYFEPFDLEIKRILVDESNKEHLEYIITNKLGAETEAYLEDSVKSRRTRELLYIFSVLYPKPDEMTKMYRIATEHDSYVGIYAFLWKGKTSPRDRFGSLFWSFVTQRKKKNV